MVKPIPDNVKEILSQLSSSQQVVLRSYIATLRSEIVTYEEEKLNADNTDPHAHYHGDVKCTADHGHVDTEHTDHHHEHVHTEHCAHEHDHKDKDTHGTEHGHEHKHAEHSCDHDHSSKEKDHDHGHHEHKHTEKHDDNHQHAHHEHTEDCGHGHDHKEQNHHHDHTHTEAMEHDHHDNDDDDAPAWKKAALSADPMAAPFGGTWNAESNISASDGTKKMEE
jgi:hypothetical protein